MGSSLADTAVTRHRQSLEVPAPKMAKANLQKLEADYRASVGECMARARKTLGWSLQELANEIGQTTGEARDLSQLGRWEKGKERLQTDVLMALPAFGPQFVIALAQLRSDQIEVVTEIRVRRTA